MKLSGFLELHDDKEIPRFPRDFASRCTSSILALLRSLPLPFRRTVGRTLRKGGNTRVIVPLPRTYIMVLLYKIIRAKIRTNSQCADDAGMRKLETTFRPVCVNETHSGSLVNLLYRLTR